MKHLVRWAYDIRELGEAVRRVRRQQNMTQAELAERLGVGRGTIRRLEQGESVSAETALRALGQCGYAVAIVPKFSRLSVEQDSTDPRRGTEPDEAHSDG
jgi:transcriptional regulator with XRE-family HTH domain